MRIAYVGNFTQQHCTEVHIAATLEDMGHKVTRIQENSTPATELIGMIRGSDLFLFTRTWGTLVTLDHLKQIEAMDIPTVSYHLDLYVGLKREDGLDNDPFWRTQYVFTPDGDPASAEVFKRKGINHFYMKPGVFKQECYPGTQSPSLMHDVVFVGGGLEYMHPEWPYRGKLVQWLVDTYGPYNLNLNGIAPRFGKYGHPQRTMRNGALNDLYASAKIAIGDSVCLNFEHSYYWSDRVYETIGRGGFIIHPYIKGMEEEFTDRVNIIFYEYGNFKQLREFIDYYLTNDEERERIRKAGQEYVRAHCTYHNRLQQMINVVFGCQPSEIASHIITEAGFDPGESSGDSEVRTAYTPHSDNHFVLPLKINLGAGTDPTPGYVNVDFINLPGIDVVHNLMQFPYPFDDASASHIKAVDVLEHLDHYTDDKRPSVVAFIEECYRILKPGGELFIQTPAYDAEFLWIDPTHVRGFHEQSMNFFDPDKHFGQTTGFYSKAKFSVSVEALPNRNLRFTMIKRGQIE